MERLARLTGCARALGKVAAVTDPYHVLVATSELARLSGALDVVERADFNDRYRKLISDSRELLAQEQVRLTQARGIAKKLMVLSRRAGEDFHAGLDEPSTAQLRAGLDQADELVYET